VSVSLGEKVCPIMSNPNDNDSFNSVIFCKKGACQLWISVYTTELKTHYGCAFELQPCMVAGQFRS